MAIYIENGFQYHSFVFSFFFYGERIWWAHWDWVFRRSMYILNCRGALVSLIFYYRFSQMIKRCKLTCIKQTFHIFGRWIMALINMCLLSSMFKGFSNPSAQIIICKENPFKNTLILWLANRMTNYMEAIRIKLISYFLFEFCCSPKKIIK